MSQDEVEENTNSPFAFTQSRLRSPDAPAPLEKANDPDSDEYTLGVVGKFAVPRPNMIYSTNDLVVWRQFELNIGDKGSTVAQTFKRKPDKALKYPSDRATFETMLEDAHGAISSNTEVAGVKKRPKRVPKKHPKKSSEDWLALNGEVRTLIIITLPEDANYLFNRRGSPFSAAEQDVKDGKIGTMGVYLPNRPANKRIEFTNAVDMSLGTGKYFDECRTAFFVLEKGVPYDDFTPYNIHLDVIGEREIRNQGNKKYYIPIIVDPDVRHPGGSNGP